MYRLYQVKKTVWAHLLHTVHCLFSDCILVLKNIKFKILMFWTDSNLRTFDAKSTCTTLRPSINLNVFCNKITSAVLGQLIVKIYWVLTRRKGHMHKISLLLGSKFLPIFSASLDKLSQCTYISIFSIDYQVWTICQKKVLVKLLSLQATFLMTS